MDMTMDAVAGPGARAAGAQARPVTARIYYLSPLLAGPIEMWPAVLDHVAGLGFDHVLIAPPFLPGAGGDVFLACDHERLHPALGWSGDARSGLRAVADLCRARGLALLMDVVLDRVGADGPLARARADLFAQADTGSALDPRAKAGFDAAVARPDAEGLPYWWARTCAGWAEAGLAGFRLLGLGDVPPAVVAAIRETCPEALLLAYTPGTDAARLARTGVDFVFSSLPWWDFRASWFWAEQERLADVARIVAMPEAPFAHRLVTACHEPALLRPTYLRALRFAAQTGAAWMMPMGFEFAAARALDPARDTPEDFGRAKADALLDLSAEITALNAARAVDGRLAAAAAPRLLTGPGAPVAALLRLGDVDIRRATGASLLLLNTDLTHRATLRGAAVLVAAGARFPRFLPADGAGAALTPDAVVALDPGEVATFVAEAAPERTQSASAKATEDGAVQATAAPRIGIERVTPSVDDGRFPVKRIAGEMVTVEADVICDGHDMLGVALHWKPEGEQAWRQTRMAPLGNDRWQASFPLLGMGDVLFTVEAWRDAFATFRDELAKKHAAGVNTRLEILEGRDLVSDTARATEGALGKELAALSNRLEAAAEDDQRAILLAPETARMMADADPRPFGVRVEPPLRVQAERAEAGFASWYEVFPRSMSDDENRHGTFDDVIRHLPRIRDMGFDVLYFPPIHPIGKTNRKGRNNSLTPAPDDPGSPYAIGSADGGHDALHPALGTFADFARLRDAAAAHGLELAIDFAIQCSPDHPWLREHKEWFAFRPDGSLRYAENPPKKYEDIVNVDFYAEGAKPALWRALRDVVLFWAEQGVRLFRVDNPHTKPFPFWEWMIASVRRQYPDAVFLAEAFTRPKVMYRLAKIGFSQSYTYFTWRNTKQELQEYATELATTAPRDFFRPHYFVNTPDINPVFLQGSGRPGFLIRAALAATLSGLWGVYNGFELCEARALPGREEYADSEKYQLRAWDWDRPGNIVAEIAQLNRIRRMNPALHSHLGITFERADSDMVLFYTRFTPDRSNVLLVAVSLDPHQPRDCEIEVPLWEWGLPDDGALDVEDLLTGQADLWRGKRRRLRLDPGRPYAIWRARAAT